MSDQENAYGPFEKAQTVDPEVRAHVYSLVTALGGTGLDEAGNYLLGDDALACLRDLKRWLRLYDDKTNRLDVARCLAEANLVIGDLLPILETWKPTAQNDARKARLARACLELLVPLTWPLETGEEATVNHHRHTPFIQQAQVRYKAGILSYDRANILRTIVRTGVASFTLSSDERTPQEESILKLILYFFRNIAIITPLPSLPSQGLDNEISRSATIEAFRRQDVLDMVLTMCSNVKTDFKMQDVILLDIIFNLIKGVDVTKLFLNEKQLKTQKTEDLKRVLAKEKSMHRDYAKVKPTRHGRFGTMIWMKRPDERMSAISGQENLRDGRHSLMKLDKSKKWKKPQQRRKDLDHSMHDFVHQVHLTDDATRHLRKFVEQFLDSGFNPLFGHLRKFMDREAERFLDINYRQFFYTVSWFLQAERCRWARQQKDWKDRKVQTESEVERYSLIAEMTNQETFIAINRYMQTSLDNKEWQNLNAAMRCFTQVLLTVQEMAQSPLEDDQEIADNIQNRIFYEESTHDRIVLILKSYKDQGFGYLDACTELSHVFLRLLERYSKTNADLQIRSKRRAQRKKKEARQAAPQGEQNTEGAEREDYDRLSEKEDLMDSLQTSRDRKFDFTRFSAKFTSQSSVDTFVALTAFYRDLSVDQLKRAHRFFHRVAFKQDMGVLLYRVDIVALFYRMIKGPEGLDSKSEGFKEWEELVRQILKKLFKKLEERPELLIEMLFSKTRSTMYYLEYGHDKPTAATRAPAELEIKPAPGRDIDQQIGIVIAALLNNEHKMLVEWVLEVITKAAEERKAWEAEALAREENALGETEGERAEQASEKPPLPATNIYASSNEVKTAMFKNSRLKLLMSLSGFERTEEDKLGARWIIPSVLTATQLDHCQAVITKYLEVKWTDETGDREPEDLLRRVGTKAVLEEGEEAPRDAFLDDSEGEDDLADYMFPDNLRTGEAAAKKPTKGKRKFQVRKEVGDAELDARRKAREKASNERRNRIKSSLYINDSDEEMGEEENRAFFAREEENRREQAANIKAALSVGRMEAPKPKKRKSDDNQAGDRKRGRESQESGSGSDSVSDLNDASDDEPLATTLEVDEEMVDLDSSSPDREDSSDNHNDEDTPLSSQNHLSENISKGDSMLQDVPQPRLDGSAPLDKGEAGSDDDMPVLASQRRRVRGGFILEDSDDE